MVCDILLSILTGIVASLFIFIWFYMWKPKIEVSNDVAYDEQNDCIYIKVINHTKAPIHNISYELLKCNNKGDGIVNIISCNPRKTNIFILNKYDHNDDEAKYAIRLSYSNVENDIISWLKENDNYYILFNITAKHSVSGGIATVSKKYRINNIKKGKFETKLSMRILIQ